ncbi:MAG: cell division protein FtsA, partial [Chloroflexota bacterium]|nr:cell division protein FtsA [Chloroflexota bacterium]
AVAIPTNREVLHVERRGFTVDGQEGVKDPLGMSALRLEVETHIVTASATAVQNLTKCVAAAGVKIDELVVDSLASAEAVLSETEKELGVAVADIGAGTIDLALFQDGSPFHTRVLPVGGANVTNDVAIGLKTSIQVAEELKIKHGTCDLRTIGEDEQISVSVLGEDAGRTVSRLEVSQIIEARMRETFELLRNEIRAAGVGMLPAGVILTGGASQLSGAAELGREVLEMPVRVAAPAGIGGLVDTLLTPGYSTAVGLLQWGASSLASGEPNRYESAPVGGANVTNDVAIGLKTSIQVAEELKIQHGTCDLRSIGEDEQISVSVLGEDAGRTVSRLEVSQIIEARMRETFELLANEIRAAGVGMLPAGVILTGGAAQLSGAAELGREVLQMPVRVAAPAGIGGLVDTLLNPSYSTAVGLLQWGAASLASGEPARYESAPAGGGLGRLRDAIRSIFP